MLATRVKIAGITNCYIIINHGVEIVGELEARDVHKRIYKRNQQPEK